MFNFHPKHLAFANLEENTKLIPLYSDYNSESIEEKHTSDLPSKDTQKKKKLTWLLHWGKKKFYGYKEWFHLAAFI